MTMKVTVPDVVSPSYFAAVAAVELGYFKDEGIDAEFIYPPADASRALRDGEIAFIGGSPYGAFKDFPGWRGGRMLCALSHYTYWFLAARASLGLRKGDVDAVKGRTISSAGPPGLLLRRMLVEAGIDLERDNVRIVQSPPPDEHGNLARVGAQALEAGDADLFWGNGMRVAYAARHGLATTFLDIRRGDGPPAARYFTFPALNTTQRLVEEQPDVAAGAIRAIIRTQKTLKADPTVARKVGEGMSPPFPKDEAELISDLIARDAEFYDPTITEEMVARTAQFARDIGALVGEVRYEDVVATQFKHLWTSQA